MTQQLPRPQLISPRAAQTLEAVRSVTGGFDIDAWHVMDERDNALVSDEMLHGTGSSAFVYDFEIRGTKVSGVSVVGARHLAAHYRGLRHRLVASMQKTGALFIFQSFPAENMPMSVSASVVHELGDEPDFYSAIVEVADIKTGNSIQIERREQRFEQRRDGSQYERQHYQTIAQSKAYRNAVLALVPQDLLIQWKEQQLKLRKSDTITASVLDEKRSGVLRFAAQHGLSLDRRAITQLTLDQISGLGDAARDGQLPAFANSARALGLEISQGEAQPEPGRATPESTAGGQPAPRRRGRPPGPRQPSDEVEEINEEQASPPPAGPAASGPDATSTDRSAGLSDTGSQPGSATPRRPVTFEC